MKKTSFLYISVLSIVFTFPALAQIPDFSQKDSDIEARLKKDIYTLAADSFMGREAGTSSEIMARDYIIEQFKYMGLPPFFGDSTYIQPFDINGGASYGSNKLIINKISIEFSKGFFPLEFSANNHVHGEAVKVGHGLIVPEKNINDYKSLNVINKIVIIDMALPDSLKKNPVVAKVATLLMRAEIAQLKGAKGVIFYNSSVNTLPPVQYASNNSTPINIPVVFVKKSVNSLINAASYIMADFSTEIIRKEKETAYNVGAFLNNNARFTVIVGGHYDHIGYEDKSTGNPVVFNGADDNASGTSAMLELARLLSDTVREKYNFIFLGFSAEEKGLLGSSFFTKSNAVNLYDIAFMINLDMIGRLDSLKKELTVYATGTSPVWKTIIEKTDTENIRILPKKECRYGSDHFSFYSVNIPCLFFFTELHKDYHKPEDDATKINFSGLTEIVKYIKRFIESVSSGKKLPFTRVATTY